MEKGLADARRWLTPLSTRSGGKFGGGNFEHALGVGEASAIRKSGPSSSAEGGSKGRERGGRPPHS